MDLQNVLTHANMARNNNYLQCNMALRKPQQKLFGRFLYFLEKNSLQNRKGLLLSTKQIGNID